MIVYIHGANATSESFSYIRPFVKEAFNLPEIVFEYRSRDGFENNLEEMRKKLKDEKDLFFISHSLGGIYALYLANDHLNTSGGVSLATPYGGSVEADFARYFLPFNQLLRDIGTMSHVMKEANYLKAPKNWTQIVTTRGQSPWICEPNDGIVTLKSMKHRKDMEQIEVDVNHYEVVLNDKVVKIILNKIGKSCGKYYSF